MVIAKEIMGANLVEAYVSHCNQQITCGMWLRSSQSPMLRITGIALETISSLLAQPCLCEWVHEQQPTEDHRAALNGSASCLDYQSLVSVP
uniref:Uncharacterized protein n=1 Tax=Rhodnius prolixus TaxID=13249 RepID=T1HZI0_RHOPR